MVTKNLPAKKPVDALKSVINSDSVQEQFKNAVGKYSGGFLSSLITVFTSDERLSQCEPGAVVKEALKAATLRLPIEKSFGFASIVAYKEKGKFVPNFQPGYKGWIELTQRTGQLIAINDGPVFEGMTVDRDFMTGEVKITGTPKNKNVIGYFAFFRLLNGFEKSDYWTKQEVIDHATKYSAGYKAKIKVWVAEFDKMAAKTVLSGILRKYAPKSVDYLMITEREYKLSDHDQIEPETINITDDTVDTKKVAKKKEPAADQNQEPGQSEFPDDPGY